MIHEVTILTLSEKWGNKCVAAFDHDSGQLVRLVSESEHGAGISPRLTSRINLLDIVRIKIKSACPLEHQTENVLIDLDYGLVRTGQTSSIRDFEPLINKDCLVFDDKNYKINNAPLLQHSLELIKFNKMNFENNDRGKTTATFYIGDKQHKWYRITDNRYFNSTAFIPQGYAVVSLPPSDDYTKKGNGYFKYVSAIYEI